MDNLSDPHDLQRFVTAQDQGGTYERALAELRAGRKASHWIWFVFPQIAGLGQSAMSQRYAIESLEEAQAYLEHPVLGPRLVECARALLEHEGPTAREVLGEIDAVKLRSSMTLFSRCTSLPRPQKPGYSEGFCGRDENVVFDRVLERYFGDEPDEATLGLIR